jgi:hypothetical protein
MAHCRECQAGLRWGTSKCPTCGEFNPTGANPGDVALVGIAVALLSGLAFTVSKHGTGWLLNLFSN